MIAEEKLKQLTKIVGEEAAKAIDELHTKHDGEIALVIKKGRAFVTEKPGYDEAARYNSDLDKPNANTMLTHRGFVMRHLIYPSAEVAQTHLVGNAVMVVDLANKTLGLTAADQTFDLEGN